MGDLVGLTARTPLLEVHIRNFKKKMFNSKFQKAMYKGEIELWLYDFRFIVLTVALSL